MKGTSVSEKSGQRQTGPPESTPNLTIKTRLHRRLLQVLDLNEARRIPLQQLHKECAKRVDVLLEEEQVPLSGPEKQQLIREVMDEVFGEEICRHEVDRSNLR